MFRATTAKILILFILAGMAGFSEAAETEKKKKKNAGEFALSAGIVKNTVTIPMRDAIGLATDIYLPEGEGEWPAIVARTPYDRAKQSKAAEAFVKAGYAFVAQDWRGLFDSDGQFDFKQNDSHYQDGYDTIEWVAKQPWCNGKVGITGSSALGFASKTAMVARPPHLAAAATNVAPSSAYLYMKQHGGVLRAHMHDEWLKGRGEEIVQWPKPRLEIFTDHEKSLTFQSKIETPLFDTAGWYDIFLQSALDDFVALDNPNHRVIIGPTGHGEIEGLTYRPAKIGAGEKIEFFDRWLKGEKNVAEDTPRIRYFLMGDAKNPRAAGNVWKQTDIWPIPHTPLSFYLGEEGALTNRTPVSSEGTVDFIYDPADPAPTIGGANLSMKKGPMDQSPLSARNDILRFATKELQSPVEITGRVLVELFVSTDVPDTTFMAKLIDVYPDGTEALVLDSAIMARYWQGFDAPAPLEIGKTYKLTIDLWSTALVFGKGHRIALHLAGSNWPRYEVHPNSYEPVDSYDNAPIAHNKIHISRSAASRMILPIVAPGASKDYQPR